MNRRKFLRGLAVAPVAAVALSAIPDEAPKQFFPDKLVAKAIWPTRKEYFRQKDVMLLDNPYTSLYERNSREILAKWMASKIDQEAHRVLTGGLI